MRFREFLRVSVLLFGGAASALAVVSVAGAAGADDTLLLLVALGWWVIAAAAGLWLGRRLAVTPGIGRLLADAKSTTTLPELEAGTVLYNRLWPLALLAVASGAAGLAHRGQRGEHAPLGRDRQDAQGRLGPPASGQVGVQTIGAALRSLPACGSILRMPGSRSSRGAR